VAVELGNLGLEVGENLAVGVGGAMVGVGVMVSKGAGEQGSRGDSWLSRDAPCALRRRLRKFPIEGKGVGVGGMGVAEKVGVISTPHLFPL